jgi:hypothetical protein
LSSPERPRAADFIQNTMTVTNATAMMLAMPPTSSWASKVSCRVPKVSTAPNDTERAMAVPTPAHT